MIHFEGTREFPQPPILVFASLGDASFLVDSVKDVQDLSVRTVDRAVWKLQPKLSFVRTKLDISMDIVERSEATGIKVKLVSRGIGATATVNATLQVEAAGTGSRVKWAADVAELTGLLKLVPKGLITSTAQKVIEETWDEIGAKFG